MIAGVTSDGPSQVTPRNGWAKLDAGSRRLYDDPAVSPLRVNVPSSPVVAESTTRRPSRASTLIPGRPFSRGSIAPGRPPPPGAKSSQTTPDTLAASAVGGATAC